MKFFYLILSLFLFYQCKEIDTKQPTSIRINPEKYTINDIEYIFQSGGFDSYDSKTKIFKRQYFKKTEEIYVSLNNNNIKKEILEVFLANKKELINFDSEENFCNENYNKSEPADYANFYLIIKQNKYRFVIYYDNPYCIDSPAYKILKIIKNNLYRNNIIKNLEETDMYLE